MSLNAVNEVQIVVFTLEKEEYGLDIRNVQEIIRMPQFKKVPGTDSCKLGIINLRGCIIPILDLKYKFLGKFSDYVDSKVMIVENNNKKLGIVVDDVDEILLISTDKIVCMENVGVSINHQFLMGIAKLKERLLLMLNVEELNK